MADLINSNERNLRYGVSALDISHKEYAENDELLVDGKTGQMLYKRDDGHITTESYRYNRAEFLSAITSAQRRRGSSVPINDDEYLVYNSIEVAGKVNAVSNAYNTITGAVFISDKPDSGFYVRVAGSDRANAIASYLEARYKVAHPDTTLAPVSMVVEVTELGIDAIKNVTVNMGFDELALVPLCEGFNPTEGCDGYRIEIKNVSFPLLFAAYAELQATEREYIKSLNYGNTRLEPSAIDVMYYVTDCTNSHIYDTENGIKLNYIISTKETEQSDSIVISSDKPNYKCIWGQIKD